ncbi:hypothetical protein L207DRAFT_571570 [Hyaloscypha variabilis F]|uniref:Uncharacterized protein n=1 Tax=Hyaloscypha variabilis (strain UAMH 11265 / GT02V1 / F) TaxID=1149755 RepID=A0A2J6R4J1_HYAVF|nr:hypothetical protein L207DRAFT_571570 [Hyaloscypha variabilis F]
MSHFQTTTPSFPFLIILTPHLLVITSTTSASTSTSIPANITSHFALLPNPNYNTKPQQPQTQKCATQRTTTSSPVSTPSPQPHPAPHQQASSSPPSSPPSSHPQNAPVLPPSSLPSISVPHVKPSGLNTGSGKRRRGRGLRAGGGGVGGREARDRGGRGGFSLVLWGRVRGKRRVGKGIGKGRGRDRGLERKRRARGRGGVRRLRRVRFGLEAWWVLKSCSLLLQRKMEVALARLKEMVRRMVLMRVWMLRMELRITCRSCYQA